MTSDDIALGSIASHGFVRYKVRGLWVLKEKSKMFFSSCLNITCNPDEFILFRKSLSRTVAVVEACKLFLWVKNLMETNEGKERWENCTETLYKWDYTTMKSTSRERIYSETSSTKRWGKEATDQLSNRKQQVQVQYTLNCLKLQ